MIIQEHYGSSVKKNQRKVQYQYRKYRDEMSPIKYCLSFMQFLFENEYRRYQDYKHFINIIDYQNLICA